MFGLEWEELKSSQRKLHTERLHRFSSPDIIWYSDKARRDGGRMWHAYVRRQTRRNFWFKGLKEKAAWKTQTQTRG